MSHQNHQNVTGGTPKAAQTSGSNKAVAGKFKIVRTPSATDDCRLTPEPEATELRELIRTLQKKEVEPKREDILPPAA